MKNKIKPALNKYSIVRHVNPLNLSMRNDPEIAYFWYINFRKIWLRRQEKYHKRNINRKCIERNNLSDFLKTLKVKNKRKSKKRNMSSAITWNKMKRHMKKRILSNSLERGMKSWRARVNELKWWKLENRNKMPISMKFYKKQ